MENPESPANLEYFPCKAWGCRDWGVSPHKLTLTIITTLPWYLLKSTSLPSRQMMVTLNALETCSAPFRQHRLPRQ